MRPVHLAAIFKMADVPTEFLDRRQWHHLKRLPTAKSILRKTMNSSFESWKNELLKKLSAITVAFGE